MIRKSGNRISKEDHSQTTELVPESDSLAEFRALAGFAATVLQEI
jgi:hypothetical protein